MIWIFGLGNPGKKFEKTRHNVGFRIVSALREKENFSNFEFHKKSNSFMCKGNYNQKEIMLVQPMTFMNVSGSTVNILSHDYDIENQDIIVVHDDIDLKLGKIKISKSKGAGGHKGVESIIKYLEEKNFTRIRIGIQPKLGKPESVEKFVLKKFNREEEKILKEVIEKTIYAIKMVLKEGPEKTMGEFNK